MFMRSTATRNAAQALHYLPEQFSIFKITQNNRSDLKGQDNINYINAKFEETFSAASQHIY